MLHERVLIMEILTLIIVILFLFILRFGAFHSSSIHNNFGIDPETEKEKAEQNLSRLLDGLVLVSLKGYFTLITFCSCILYLCYISSYPKFF